MGDGLAVRTGQREGWTKVDRYNEATWLTAQFPSEPATGWRVFFAILCCLIAVLVAGAASVVGYYAFAGYRWTRIGALVALGVSTAVAAAHADRVDLDRPGGARRGPLWLPASTGTSPGGESSATRRSPTPSRSTTWSTARFRAIDEGGGGRAGPPLSNSYFLAALALALASLSAILVSSSSAFDSCSSVSSNRTSASLMPSILPSAAACRTG